MNWRAIGAVGAVAALSGLFLNVAANPAVYPALDAMFAAGSIMTVGSMMLVGK